jgi:hypothetical protein
MSEQMLKVFIARLSHRLNAIKNHKGIDPYLDRIGRRVANEAKLNVTKFGMIKSGTLRDSIRHEINADSSGKNVIIAPFGVRYAAIHEFGGTMTPKMRRAMFAKTISMW